MEEYEFALIPQSRGNVPRDMDDGEPEDILTYLASALEIWGLEYGYDIKAEVENFRQEHREEIGIRSDTGAVEGRILYISEELEKFQVWLNGEIPDSGAKEFVKWVNITLESPDKEYHFSKVP